MKPETREKRNAYTRQWKRRNIEHKRQYERDYHKKHRPAKYAEAKKTVFDHYGRICVCCGESIQGFLTIDHMNNDGHILRRKGSYSRSGSAFYFWLARQIREGKAPSDLRTQCYNCNCGRHKNGGRCPHEDM